MPKAGFFRKFGLFAIERFFDADLCRRLRADMGIGAPIAATVGGRSGEFVVDRQVRSVTQLSIKDASTRLVKARLMEINLDLGRHFDTTLADCQEPQFLHYLPGDFYQPHADRSNHPNASPVSKSRLVSAVIFLNEPSAEPREGTYGGGALTFFGLLDDPAGRSLGFPLDADEGLLIAFRSDLLHSVAPVTHGDRYTISAWYV
jgi:SM-20-related protein